MLLHATCIAVDGVAVLLLGPSGAGKSDLALRLCLSPWQHDGRAVDVRLIADDQVRLGLDGEALWATAPESISGKLEVRGLGIVPMRAVASGPVAVRLAVHLVAPAEIERMPDPGDMVEILGRSVRAISIAPFEASAPAKVILAAAQHRLP